MCTLPIKLPQSFFKSLHSILLKFLWSHKKNRIKFALLTRPKENGGMGLSDFKNYYLASHLTRIIDCHCHKDTRDWFSSESGLNPIPLQFSSWILWSSYPPSLKHHPLMETTLEVFHKLTRWTDVTSLLSPLTPLKDITDFMPSIGNSAFHLAPSNKLLLAGDCFHKGKIKDLAFLKTGIQSPLIALLVLSTDA